MANSLMPGLLQEEEAFSAWALYMSKYVTEYVDAGVPIKYITVQNEPHVAKQFAVTYEACGFNATHETDFLRDYLGPQIRKDHPDVKIFIHDDQKNDKMVTMVNTAMGDPEAAKYVDGVAFHWYDDFLHNYDILDEVHEAYPDLPLLGTEATLMRPETQWTRHAGGYWYQGQTYAIDIINDLNHNAEGWIDWNMLLDRFGGPSSQHLGGTLTEKDLLDLGNCDAPIRLNITGYPRFDEQSGDGSLIYGAAYWHFGHFSRFIPPGSIRVGSSSSFGDNSKLQYVAFAAPDEKEPDTQTLVTVVLNANDNEAQYTLNIPNYGVATLTMPKQSIQTITLKL
jgi:glucosylceramidase